MSKAQSPAGKAANSKDCVTTVPANDDKRWLDAENSLDGVSVADAAAQLNPGEDASEIIYPEDIDKWAERIDVTREQLRVAIRQVGSRVDDVARFLGNPDVR